MYDNIRALRIRNRVVGQLNMSCRYDDTLLVPVRSACHPPQGHHRDRQDGPQTRSRVRAAASESGGGLNHTRMTTFAQRGSELSPWIRDRAVGQLNPQIRLPAGCQLGGLRVFHPSARSTSHRPVHGRMPVPHKHVTSPSTYPNLKKYGDRIVTITSSTR